jgi:hypothetical protein
LNPDVVVEVKKLEILCFGSGRSSKFSADIPSLVVSKTDTLEHKSLTALTRVRTTVHERGIGCRNVTSGVLTPRKCTTIVFGSRLHIVLSSLIRSHNSVQSKFSHTSKLSLLTNAGEKDFIDNKLFGCQEASTLSTYTP